MSTARIIGRLFAVLVAFGFVLAVSASLLGYNAASSIASRGFMNTAVSDTRLFEAIISQAARELSETVPTDPNTRDLPIARLSEADWERILLVMAPPQSLQTWVRDALARFDPWAWRGGSFYEATVIPFGDMLSNLVNDPNLTLVRALAATLPTCASGQDPWGPLGVSPVCIPAESGREALIQEAGRYLRETPAEVLQQLLPESVSRFTRNMTLAELIEQQSGKRWEDVRAGWRWAGWSLGLGRLVLALLIAGGALVTLGIIALLAARNPAEAMRWIGLPVFLAGLVTLAWGLFIWIGASNWPRWGVSSADLTLKMQAAIGHLLDAFAGRWSVPMLWQGGILVVLGLVVWGASYLLPKRRPKE